MYEYSPNPPGRCHHKDILTFKAKEKERKEKQTKEYISQIAMKLPSPIRTGLPRVVMTQKEIIKKSVLQKNDSIISQNPSDEIN